MGKLRSLRTIFFVLPLLSSFSLHALKREYWNEESRYSCALHVDDSRPDDAAQNSKDLGIDQELLNLIPAVGPKCDDCSSLSIYSGYLDRDSRKYISNLERELRRLKDHPECTCCWPECSEAAAQISDEAYELFYDLIAKTNLSKLLSESKDQRSFLGVDRGDLNTHGVTISLIATQFRFSDYYDLCNEIDDYARFWLRYRSVKKYYTIRKKLDCIVNTLYSRFFALYNRCMELHPSPEINEELLFMRLLVADDAVLRGEWPTIPTQGAPATKASETKAIRPRSKNRHQGVPKSPKKKALPSPLSVHVLLKRGAFLNDNLQYQEGILLLSEAIKESPCRKETYLERARAYFETGQIDLALQDYRRYKNLSGPPFIKSPSHAHHLHCRAKGILSAIYTEEELDFLEGLKEGICVGSKEAINGFFPSLLNSCKGMGMGLWAVATEPEEVVQELYTAAVLFGEYCADNYEEILNFGEKAVAELAESWDDAKDFQRGYLVGHLIGKYGVEFFGVGVGLKCINEIQALKEANTILTFEQCAISETKRAAILEQSSKVCAARAKLLEAASAGKIVARNMNVVPHMMQERHAWGRLVDLSGETEKDFQAVVKMLEKNGVFEKECLWEEKQFKDTIRRVYKKVVDGKNVRLEFIKDKQSGAFLLSDGWVETK